jgi:hypothetical protein
MVAKWVTVQSLARLAPILLCVRIACSPYIVVIVFFVCVLLSETDKNEEGMGEVLDKNL